MNLRHLNSHRSRDEGQDAFSEEDQNLLNDDQVGLSLVPENKQGLKKELWTRIIRVGDEFLGEIRLHEILNDIKSFHESPPDSIPPGRRPWALLFDIKACNTKFKDKTEV